MIPSFCHMPSLQGQCEPLTPTLLLRLGFVGDGTLGRKAALYRRLIVRLVDKAVYEYNMARQALVMQIEEGQRPTEEMKLTGRIIHIFGFVDHMENCLNATRRLLWGLDHIKREASAPPIARPIRQSIAAHAKEIFAIRDVLEHITERIDRGDTRSSEPVLLAISDDGQGVALGKACLRFESIALVIRHSHAFASELLAAP
jgi:hypothetical protein